MKAESNIKPLSPYEITYDTSDMIHIGFYEMDSIVEKETDEGDVKFEYNYYTLKVRNRPYLINSLDNNYAEWLQLAKDNELKVVFEETDREKVLRLEKDNKDLEGVIADLVQILADKGVVW